MVRMAAKAETIKAKALQLIDQLPEDATWEDVAYEIAVRRSIERGLADLDANREVSLAEAKARFGLA